MTILKKNAYIVFILVIILVYQVKLNENEKCCLAISLNNKKFKCFYILFYFN